MNMLQTSPLSYTRESSARTLSPLAPLNPNACPRFLPEMTCSGQTSSGTSKCLYRRPVKNSLLQRKPHEERDRRRQVFLDKVRQVSADKRWESRSEQILRNDFLQRQKEWERDQSLSAPEAPQVFDDDEQEADSISMKEVEMVDQILSQKHQEFEALVLSMQGSADQEHHQQKSNLDYGSDEEEYDRLFMEVISRQGSAKRVTSIVGHDPPKQDEEMDISVG